MRRILNWALYALYSFVVAFVFLGAIEGVLAWLYHRPELVRTVGPRRALQNVYASRRISIQQTPECARWNRRLTYTLRPGRCRYAQVEFDTEYRINSLGLRDDESSLIGPEIVVLGDSHSMGWGVEQQETYAQRLERASGLDVLNAAVSSYGTARQVVLLEQLDLSRLRLLIVQYSDNDFWENRTFLRFDRRLPVRSLRRYRRGVNQQEEGYAYYPGMFLRGLLTSRPEPRGLPPPGADALEVEMFLEILLGSAALPASLPVLVLEITDPEHTDGRFITALQAEIDSGRVDRRIETLAVDEIIASEHHYVLDDHMMPEGHELVAGAIEERLEGLLPHADR